MEAVSRPPQRQRQRSRRAGCRRVADCATHFLVTRARMRAGPTLLLIALLGILVQLLLAFAVREGHSLSTAGRHE